MRTIQIPGLPTLEVPHLLLDVKGRLTDRSDLIEDLETKLSRLQRHLRLAQPVRIVSPANGRRAAGREAQDETQRALRAGPMLADKLLSAALKEAPKNERHDYRVVELAGDRNEIGHQIERQRQVAGERDE